jgi:hypothetical protein
VVVDDDAVELAGAAVSVRSATAEDAGVLYATARAVPEAWWGLGRSVLSSPARLVDMLEDPATEAFVIERPTAVRTAVGCAALFDGDDARGTLWLGVAILPGPAADETRVAAARLLADHVFESSSVSALYGLHLGFEEPPFRDVPGGWVEAARTPHLFHHEGLYWDEIVTAVHRRSWAGARAG